MRDHSTQLSRRCDRHREFYSGHEPGDLLVYINGARTPSLEGFLCAKLYESGPDVMLEPGAIQSTIRNYVDSLRESFDHFYAIDDDSVPSAIVYWGIGGITAAMIDGDPRHDGTTSWLEPNLPWSEIDKLAFNPENKWLRLAIDINTALWECWENDFMVLPYLHRSPLDAANGIRGTELFVDMYDAPDRVIALADWCADWSIAVETLIKAEAPRPPGWGVGVWGAWLPDDAVFVNGDPVGLINRKQGQTFDRPSNEKLFTSTGGGFFHNHTIGLHQVDLVSSYEGCIVQWFVDDPNQPSLESALLDLPVLREKILSASFKCPVAGFIGLNRLDEILDIVRHGRFILSIGCPQDVSSKPIIRKVRQASKLN